jgi:hypothetical protein
MSAPSWTRTESRKSDPHKKIRRRIKPRRNRGVIHGDRNHFIVVFCQTWKRDWTGAVDDRSWLWQEIDRQGCMYDRLVKIRLDHLPFLVMRGAPKSSLGCSFSNQSFLFWLREIFFWQKDKLSVLDCFYAKSISLSCLDHYCTYINHLVTATSSGHSQTYAN